MCFTTAAAAAATLTTTITATFTSIATTTTDHPAGSRVRVPVFESSVDSGLASFGAVVVITWEKGLLVGVAFEGGELDFYDLRDVCFRCRADLKGEWT